MNQPSPPIKTPLIQEDEKRPETKDLYKSEAWIQYDQVRDLQIQSSARVAKNTPLDSQVAAIPTSSAFLTTGAGLFRVSWLHRISVPASVSSALQITIGWVRSGIAQTKVGASLTGNTTTTQESGTTLVRADGLTDITFSESYASVGTAMQYELDVLVEGPLV